MDDDDLFSMIRPLPLLTSAPAPHLRLPKPNKMIATTSTAAAPVSRTALFSTSPLRIESLDESIPDLATLAFFHRLWLFLNSMLVAFGALVFVKRPIDNVVHPTSRPRAACSCCTGRLVDRAVEYDNTVDKAVGDTKAHLAAAGIVVASLYSRGSVRLGTARSMAPTVA